LSPETVLVVDDEAEILAFVRRYLERDGFRVVEATSGQAALARAAQGVDLVVLDLMIPPPDGLEVTRRLRAGSSVPILILTARGEEADRVAGLELGADDYLTKPFSPRELVARVKALLRRVRMPPPGCLAAGAVTLDRQARRVRVAGQPVELTPREYELLAVLMGAPGKTFTRDELLERVWGPEYSGDTRRVDAHVSHLRQKLSRPGQPAPIRSVWGVGYRLERP
jgi:DNA-binding response OmpR family regulator